jgi:hypothetical protein
MCVVIWPRGRCVTIDHLTSSRYLPSKTEIEMIAVLIGKAHFDMIPLCILVPSLTPNATLYALRPRTFPPIQGTDLHTAHVSDLQNPCGLCTSTLRRLSSIKSYSMGLVGPASLDPERSDVTRQGMPSSQQHRIQIDNARLRRYQSNTALLLHLGTGTKTPKVWFQWLPNALPAANSREAAPTNQPRVPASHNTARDSSHVSLNLIA